MGPAQISNYLIVYSINISTRFIYLSINQQSDIKTVFQYVDNEKLFDLMKTQRRVSQYQHKYKQMPLIPQPRDVNLWSLGAHEDL